jgi:hypothetical protein
MCSEPTQGATGAESPYEQTQHQELLPTFPVVELADTPVSTSFVLVGTTSIGGIIATGLAVWTIRMKATHHAIGSVVELAVLTVGGRSDVHRN